MISTTNNWQYFLNQVPQAEQIHMGRGKEINDLISRYEDIFGKGWWQYAAENQHLIFWYLHSVLWNPDNHVLDELANSLLKLRRVEGYDDILRRARRAEEFNFVETEIKLGSRMFDKCSDFVFNEATGDKKPDIRCTFEGLTLLMEVKTLSSADETKKARRTQEEILKSCL